MQESTNDQIDQLIIRLRRYNEWRRGADFEHPDPAEIGRDIDAAIAAIERLAKLNKNEYVKHPDGSQNGTKAQRKACLI